MQIKKNITYIQLIKLGPSNDTMIYWENVICTWHCPSIGGFYGSVFLIYQLLFCLSLIHIYNIYTSITQMLQDSLGAHQNIGRRLISGAAGISGCYKLNSSEDVTGPLEVLAIGWSILLFCRGVADLLFDVYDLESPPYIVIFTFLVNAFGFLQNLELFLSVSFFCFFFTTPLGVYADTL